MFYCLCVPSGGVPKATEEITRTSITVLPSISEVRPAIRTSSVNEALVSTLVVPDLETSHPVVPGGSVNIPPSATVTSGSRVLTGGAGVSLGLSTDSESQGGETDPPAEKKSGWLLKTL